MTATLRVMADYGAVPVWALRKRRFGANRDIGMVAAERLAISSELKNDLQSWADVFDANGLRAAWSGTPEHARWVEAGRVLAARLDDELGPRYEVFYFNDLTGRDEKP